MKSKQRIPWNEKTIKQKASFVGTVFGCFLGCCLIAYAASSLFTHDSFTINNTKGSVFSMDLTGELEGIEVVPGTEQSVAPSIQNTGTEPMYVFVRFDVGTTASGFNVYSFTPDENSGWTQVGNESGSLLFVYGSNDSLVAVNSQNAADLSGTLTCIATGSDFVMLEDVSVKVTGCAIESEGEDGNAAEVYQDYINLGGE